MKMDFFRLTLTVFAITAFTACGKKKTAESTFEKSESSCASNVVEKQFIVKRYSGKVEVVQAESKEEFIGGYLTKNLDEIEYAEHDYRVNLSSPETSVQASAPTFADNWGVARVGVETLWQQNIRGNGVIVAVIDTGVDINHPQLASRIHVNAGESGVDTQGRNRATNGVDDDNDGYIDNVSGYNFVTKSKLTGDDNGHGTHVAGIIAAAHGDSVASSSTHVQGMAPGAQIIPLKFLDKNGAGVMSDGVLAIRYAVMHGAKIINASWGGPDCSRTLRDEIAALDAQNVIFVAAAGNSGQDLAYSPEYPAVLDLPAQITVGAVGSHDYMAKYSNYGTKAVHIFAPGTYVVSTWPDGQMASLSGTSMATPFVAGAIALLRSVHPNATAAQIRSALYLSAFQSDYLNASQGRLALQTTLTELNQIIGN